MECDICADHISGEPGLYCPACARGILYPLRVHYVTTLLSKGALSKKVESIVYGAKAGRNIIPASSDGLREVEKLAYEAQAEEMLESKRRIDRVMEQNDILRERIDSHKKRVAEQKAATAQKRRDLAKAKDQFKTIKDTSVEPLQKSIKSIMTRHAKIYRHIVSARGYLCKQAAILAGLHQASPSADEAEDSPCRAIHTIGGLRLIDLRDLNHAEPRELSASMTHAAHLVSNVCHYLGLRLPAELVIPCKEWPYPSIFSIPASYLALNDQERSAILQSPYTSSSLSTSRQLESKKQHLRKKNQPRPRPLHLDKKLLQIAREDPALYSLHLEGLALFAWDIAWLCRTQGVLIADDNWEDICAIGHNLWSLLMVASRSHTQPPLLPKGDASNSAPEATSTTTPSRAFGVLSYATSHTFLRSPLTIPSPPPPPYSSRTTHDDDVAAPAWKHASPTKFIDKLKATLWNDLSGLEWELLEDESFGILKGDGVVARDRSSGGGGGGEEEERGGGGVPVVVVGSSGWTKLKSRSSSGV